MTRWRVPAPPYAVTRFTHHVWYDAADHRIGLALCGFILPRRDSVVDPTCPVCRAILADRDRTRGPQPESEP